ncbi:hypothetical protein [Caulobacter vibrioides]|uniref:Uncharacterized protein n=1 Tax=Caulobacter vibrioides (strain NA1000 / CB15N) TaxID=565050 RepID=A0A0H3J1J5_CAUVN|nr:hypothetical protein [Caulobacter vibrioides]YP_009020509.1 hypothetical protein CCNA_03937 [Caulobacter vibrioides NA1000]AHI88540.1 hypothetical protein CCNA_03937 [Caulobacter vibrioides NA1000]ATC27576.1 hypothetical protein CA607_03915 [Caulobacter vibrioides]QXZ52814.1 hypothetical protein KZH45_03825 [Caulobacter vibrioides]
MSDDTSKRAESSIAEKIGSVETAADFLRRRAGDARPTDLLNYLDRAGDAAPVPGDEALKAS